MRINEFRSSGLLAKERIKTGGFGPCFPVLQLDSYVAAAKVLLIPLSAEKEVPELRSAVGSNLLILFLIVRPIFFFERCASDCLRGS